MKLKVTTLIVPISAVVALVALSGASPQQSGRSCCMGMMAMHDGGVQEKPVIAKMVNGVQSATIVIDKGVYTPAAISVVKGKPVELTFKAGKQPGCGGTVVFKSLDISKAVGDKPVAVEFTPKKPGTIEFTCGMGMFDGKVIVK